MNNEFNSFLVKKPRRNYFDLSHDRKLSMKMGRLYPIFVQEILPSDHFDIQEQHMIRFAPMVAPVMHEIDVTYHYWFVPNRILWNGWEDFMASTQNMAEMPVSPYIEVNGDEDHDYNVSIGDILEYMDVPVIKGELKKLKLNAFIPAFSGV